MKNNCSIVRDLLPLYAEDMVSKDTAEFVDEHLENCTECKEELKVLKEGRVSETESEIAQAEKAKAKSFKKIMKKVNIKYDVLGSLFIVFAVLFGLALSDSNDMFYNLFLMPVVGVCGYCIFSYKAFYKIPVLVAITHLFAFGVKLAEYESLWFTYYYIILALTGIAIALLFHISFRKSSIKNKAGKIALKIGSLFTALILTGIISFVGFVFVGNPVSLILAKNGAEKYISQTYPDTDYIVTDVGHEFKHGGYYANVESPSSEDIWFSIYLDGMGNVVLDLHSSYVENGSNTGVRLNREYDEMINRVLSDKTLSYKVDYCDGFLNIPQDEKLEADEIYNVNEMAKEIGEVNVRVYSDDLSYERMAEVLLEAKENLDRAGVNFKSMDCAVINEEDGSDILFAYEVGYSDIKEEGLVQYLTQKAGK